MNIKDLVVTGIVKFLKVVSIDTLIVEKLNEVTKSELDSLHGVTSNIQDQIESVSSSLETAELEQKNFKGAIVRAINAIPRNPNNPAINFDSALSQITHNLGEIEHGPDVSGVTATADKLVEGLKFVDKNWNTITGTMVNHGWSTNPHSIGWNDGEGAVFVRIPHGAYITGSGKSGQPEIRIPYSSFGTAVANDVLEGKTFTSAAGYKVTGNIINTEREPDAEGLSFWKQEGTVPYVCCYPVAGGDERYYRIQRGIKVLASKLGDATASDVLSGKTFTSTSGIKVAGTIPSIGAQTSPVSIGNSSNNIYVRIQKGAYLTPASATAGAANNYPEIMISHGTFGDAEASNVLAGKTFTSSAGYKVTGTLKSLGLMPMCTSVGTFTEYSKNYLCLYIEHDYSLDPRVVMSGVIAPWEKVGDAAETDVLAGKTFTSSAGVKRSGKIVSRAAFYHNGTKDAAHGSSDGIVCGMKNATQTAHGVTAEKPFYYIRFPSGYYGGWGAASNAEVQIDATKMNDAIGLTPDKIKKGEIIAGVTGMYLDESSLNSDVYVTTFVTVEGLKSKVFKYKAVDINNSTYNKSMPVYSWEDGWRASIEIIVDNKFPTFALVMIESQSFTINNILSASGGISGELIPYNSSTIILIRINSIDSITGKVLTGDGSNIGYSVSSRGVQIANNKISIDMSLTGRAMYKYFANDPLIRCITPTFS